MTLPSQFSLEEENFYKDIQDLVKKGSQNEKELSLFLERYKGLLARADLDDETFIINFAKAGLIIEASAKVYGIKVDNLWINLEHVLESLKNKGCVQSNKKKFDCENGGDNEDNACDDLQEEDKQKGLGFLKRRKKLGDSLFSSDDFLEIDNVTGLLGKNMNESTNNCESKIKLCEKVPSMFIKNKTKKKKVDVWLNKCLDDKDVIRLRDWIISTECLLIKEIYTVLPETIFSVANKLSNNELIDAYEPDEYQNDDLMFNDEEVNLVQESIKHASSFNDEKNNNVEIALPLEASIKEPTNNELLKPLEADSFANRLNISRESDVLKLPNALEQVTKDCLVDVDEVFWNPSKFQDVIPSKKMRAGKTNKLTCQLCVDRKLHKKKGKKCLESKKIECLDSYFTPHVQPMLTESHFGIFPDEELYCAYKTEMKLIEQLKKLDSCKNTNGAYYPEENAEDLRSFLGFDGFETCLIRKPELLEEDQISVESMFDGMDDDECCSEILNMHKDVELPFPVTDTDGGKNSDFLDNNNDEDNIKIYDERIVPLELEYQKLVSEELKEHYAAKSSFGRSKELGIKISKWFEMISDKIKLSQKRGALNMKSLADKIMNAFPTQSNGELPVMTFRDLVTKQNQMDIPRYFFACLQLANEGNIEIGKLSKKSLTTDCMVITQLRSKNINSEFDEQSVISPSKGLNSSRIVVMQTKRKRNLSVSPSVVESKIQGRQKKLKQKVIKTCKRPKTFNLVDNIKKRRCSMSSIDSLMSE